MNIDFHYGIVYVISRLAGLSVKEAEIVAHSCQYVDDATTNGVLNFEGGESYERFASAHEMLDYKNLIDDQDRLVWAPFHFLPGGVGESLEEKAICRPDSEIAREMMRRAIEGKLYDNSLHRLGISLHVYVDTWAHQGFSGIKSKLNNVKSLSGNDHSHEQWLEKLRKYVLEVAEQAQSNFLDVASKLGHGAALHFPDMPWAKWEYTNGHDKKIFRENLPDFVVAANMACKAIQGYINENLEFENEPGLSESGLKAIEGLLQSNQNHDGEARLQVIYTAVENGEFSELQEQFPRYIAKGNGSWKHSATGIADKGDGNRQPKWSEQFEDSDYRKFHDAVKQHRFDVTQKILPAHGVRLA
jgi:hypothetical protein